MKLKNLTEKTRQAVRKIGPKTLIAICAVLVFGCAVTLNFILRDHDAAAPKLKEAMATVYDATDNLSLLMKSPGVKVSPREIIPILKRTLPEITDIKPLTMR